MLLQTDPGGWQFGLLVLVLAGVGLVSYWLYRDAAARGMDDAPYWGAAVGVASVIGVVVGGVVAVGVYLSARPDEYEGGERPFDAIWGEAGTPTASRHGSGTDPAHADLPSVPESPSSASPTPARRRSVATPGGTTASTRPATPRGSARRCWSWSRLTTPIGWARRVRRLAPSRDPPAATAPRPVPMPTTGATSAGRGSVARGLAPLPTTGVELRLGRT